MVDFQRRGYPQFGPEEEEGTAKPCAIGIEWVNLTTLKTIREDAIRDEFLLKRAKMDPDIADKISGLLWNAVDEATGLVAKAAHDKLAQTRVYKQASLLYYTRKLNKMQMAALPGQRLGIAPRAKHTHERGLKAGAKPEGRHLANPS